MDDCLIFFVDLICWTVDYLMFDCFICNGNFLYERDDSDL
jgi:hypothetical protein